MSALITVNCFALITAVNIKRDERETNEIIFLDDISISSRKGLRVFPRIENAANARKRRS